LTSDIAQAEKLSEIYSMLSVCLDKYVYMTIIKAKNTGKSSSANHLLASRL